MKVIFIEDVPNVARAGQNKVVADGYARNFLFPRKLAVLESTGAAAAVEAHIKKVAKQRAIIEAEMAELAKVITGTEITLKAKVGEKGHLYGSVTGADIAAELGKTISREIDKRTIVLPQPIRDVGVYDVIVRFTHEITAMVVVVVMSDEAGAVKPVRAEKTEEEAEKAEKPKAEKKPKKEKAPKEEKPAEEQPAAVAEEKPAAEKAEVKAEKKEKKPKKEKAPKEEKPAEKPAKQEKAAEEPAKEEKKEKKPKAEKKSKKAEDKTEEK